MIDNMSDGFAYLKIVMNREKAVDFIFIEMNPSFRQMIGVGEENIVGKRVTEIMPLIQDDSFDWIGAYGQITMTGSSIRFEKYFGTFDKWFLFHAFCCEKGYLTIAVHDSSEEKKALEEQKKIRAGYEMIFNGTQDLMFLMDIDEKGLARYHRLNRIHETLSGLTTAEIVGKSPQQVFGPELGNQIDAHFHECIQTKSSLVYQETLKFPSGSRIWSTMLSPVFKDGKVVQIIGSRRDITEQKQVEADLFQEKEQLKVTLHSIGDAVITTDTLGRITLINGVAEKLTGWSAEEAIGRPLEAIFCIINEETQQLCDSPIRKVLDTGLVVELANHTVLIAKDGTKRFIADSGAPIRDKEGKVFGVVLVFRDVTDKKLQEDEIRYLSFHDKLTGLYNRAFFEREMERLDQAELLPLSLVIGDVNGLKLTNDIFGHEVGDKLLKTIAGILVKECYGEEIIARWGGDEFVIVLPRTSKDQVQTLCRQIQDHCGIMPEDPIRPNITFGAATKEVGANDMNQILKEAEDIMYRRKLLEGKSVRSSLITSLEKTLYARSYETEEHAQRILNIALKVGNEMGLSSSELDELGLLAILHDIGKIGIPDYILTKPIQLSPDEWREMKKHPEIGYRIAQSSPELSHVADLILFHHERWDGKGYPIGLKGNDIPKLARIVAVIDAYDVMTHSRPYKDAISAQEAVEEIRKCAGSQFDPVVAEFFTRVIYTPK